MTVKKKELDEYIDVVTTNINADRALASKLLTDLMQEMAKSSDKYTHKELGGTAASYLETLQRSNEQLVKIASILQRREGFGKGLDDLDKDKMFDLIKGE